MSIGAIEIYLFEVSIFIILLYIFNKLLLGRETLHSFNRYVWLTSIVISFSLPFVISDYSDSMAFAVLEDVSINSEISQNIVDVDTPPEVTLLQIVVNIIFMIYILGVVALIIRNIVLHLSLIKIIHRVPHLLEQSHNDEDRLLLARFREYESEMGLRFKAKYIIHNSDLAPFSWFRYVVVSRKDIEHSSQQIIFHELSHVKQLHSWDVMFVNIAIIILWFNPAVWLLKRAIQQVHEYCADESVLERGINVKEYQLLLIKKSVGSRLYSISNTLNHSNLKNRITMMLKKKTSKMAAAKCLLSIPVLFFALLLLSSPTVAQMRSDVSDAKVIKNSDTETTDDQDSDKDAPFLFAEIMPKFQDGDLPDFRNWVMNNIQYPAEAAKNNTTGRVIVSFVIEKSGKLKDIEIIHSSDESFSDETIRVLKSSPKWTPAQQRGENVRLKFTMPIEFSVQSKQPE